MDKYKNKYRIPSTRLQHWDYRRAGAYFITICTHDRIHYFGEIKNGKMILSHVGVLADVLWHEIKNHAKNVELGEFVVMPNHIHGILILTENDDINDANGNNNENKNGNGNGNNNGNNNGNGNNNVETGHALSLPLIGPLIDPMATEPLIEPPFEQSFEQMCEQPIEKTIGQQRFQNIGKNSVSSIVGSYKSAVTRHAHRLGFEFAWQTRFYDHIIRNDKSFKKISNYIINNPSNWQEDKFYN